jgi:HK97 family phage prohead protease
MTPREKRLWSAVRDSDPDADLPYRASLYVLQGAADLQQRAEIAYRLWRDARSSSRASGLALDFLRYITREESRRTSGSKPRPSLPDTRSAKDAERPELWGYAAVFGSWADIGSFDETIARGAFSRTLREGADVRALIDHDTGRILGRTKSGTLTLTEDSVGLRFHVLLPDTTDGRDAYTSVQRGDWSDCSFAFRTVDDAWEQSAADGRLKRTLKDVDLFDVSVVSLPAYPGTYVGTGAAARLKLAEMS